MSAEILALILFVLVLMVQVWLTWYIMELVFFQKQKSKLRFQYPKHPPKRQPSGNVKIISKI